MTENVKIKTLRRAFIRWAVAAALVIAVVLSGFLAGLMNRAGLLFLLLGVLASLFMGFSRQEIFAAFRHAFGRSGSAEDRKRAAYFWTAAGRNAWILGVLGSVLNFTIVLGGDSRGIADVSHRMIQSFLITLYGLVLAIVCFVPALKLGSRRGKESDFPSSRPAGSGTILFERVFGYALFVLVLGLTFISLIRSSPPGGPLPAAKVLLHGPAALVVIGGTLSLALFLGAGSGARALTFGFGMTGLVALLLGIIQAMFGFVHARIAEIAAAVSFIISASCYALLGLALFAAPLEDRELMDGRRERSGRFSWMVWWGLPLLAFLFLILTFVMVVTPVKKTG